MAADSSVEPAPHAICSRCGYDLRGIESDRCPECGFELASQRSLGGEIPWTYRRPRGYARSFVQTVIDVTIGRPWLRSVVSGTVSMRDARQFWVIASLVASLPLVAAFIYAWIRAGSLEPLIYMPDAMAAGTTPSSYRGFGFQPRFDVTLSPWFCGDVLWPLSAGYTRPGLAFVVLPLFFLLGSGAVTYLFHPRALNEAHRQRACAFAYYLISPLVVAAVPLTMALACALYGVETSAALFSMPAFLCALAALVWAGVLCLSLWRVLRTLRWTIRASPLRVAVSAMLVPILWLLAALFALVFVPWCIGMAWLLIDVFR